jgi:hypothetical protein
MFRGGGNLVVETEVGVGTNRGGEEGRKGGSGTGK